MITNELTPAQKNLLRFIPNISYCISHNNLKFIRNCVGTIIFLWLNNGKGFWFKYEGHENKYLTGYFMCNNQWRKTKVDSMNILRYY